ncbi:MAG: hypothetical protein LBT14_07095 [Treponema sp.]|jgi:hypothetical protein|nr:hypothetical protein [Treponema sp.]
MRKIIIMVSLFTLSNTLFGLDNETPSVLIELNTGYAIGIELPHSVPIEFKLVYPFTLFGFTLEVGTELSKDEGSAFHILFGPTVFVINNSKMRIPITIGLDLLANKNNTYLGLGGIIGYNYSITKNIYLAINIEINYDFNNLYEETVGYKDAAIGVDEYGNKIYPIGC